MKVFILMMSLLMSFSTFAETDKLADDYGKADSTTPELSHYEYLRGKWQIEMSMLTKDGSFQKLDTTAYLKGYYHSDGKTFQTEFTSDKGFFSTDLRSWSKETSSWQIMFLNATAQRWHQYEAKNQEGKLITLVPGGFSGKEKFDVKTVHEDIKTDTFTGNIYRSSDKGETWLHVYIMKFKRVN